MPSRRRMTSKRINRAHRRNMSSKQRFISDAKSSNRNRAKRIVNSRVKRKTQWGEKYDVTKNPDIGRPTRQYPTTSDEVISRTFNSDGTSNYKSMKRDDWMKQQNIAETRKPYTPNRRNRRFTAARNTSLPRRRKRVSRINRQRRR